MKTGTKQLQLATRLWALNLGLLVHHSLGACCPNAGARLCEPQQCRIFQEMGKFLRFLQVLSYCGPQARAPFDLGNTPLVRRRIPASRPSQPAARTSTQTVTCQSIVDWL